MADYPTYKDETTATKTVLTLFFILVLLILLLVYLYKRLNRDSNGQYTVHRMVYKQGGVRDQLRRAVRVLEGWLNVRLWPRGEEEEYEVNEETKDLVEQDKDVESVGKRAESEEENDEEENYEKERDEENGDGSSDDCSSQQGSDLGQIATAEVSRLSEREMIVKRDALGENKQDEEEQSDSEEDNRSGGAGLQIHLKQCAGSAIWSEGKGEDDVTAF